MKEIIDKLKQQEHGFKYIIKAGDDLLAGYNSDHFNAAIELLNNDAYQARMLGTYLLGQLSPGNKKALEALRTTVAEDKNWRVQEMLARAFDHYCKVTGYEKSLPVIKRWLSDKNPNVKRAVVEGLRIWTSRSYFKDNPLVAIQLISHQKSDASEYLRKSAGNALRDIRKKHKALVDQEVESWDLKNRNIAYTKKLIDK